MAKRFLKTAVVSALFALTLAVSASAASAGGATTTTAVNFRTGAGTNYGIISTLPAGTHVVVSERSSGNWATVVYNGTVGYISSDYLKRANEMDASFGTGTINGSYVRMRSGASTSSSILGTYNSGTTMTITGVNGAWYKVSYNGTTGYVHSDYVSLSGVTNGGSSTGSSNGSVKGSDVRMRSGPSTNYSILGTYQNGTPLTITGTENGWSKVTIGGVSGYIRSDYVSGGGADSKAGYIKGTGVRMRSGASTTSSILGVYNTGTKMTITGESGNGKTTLAADIVKALQKQRRIKGAKMAKIPADNLNGKNVSGVIQKLGGGALLIEKAGALRSETAVQLSHAMTRKTGGLLVILEDEKEEIRKLFIRCESLGAKFTRTIDIPVFTNKELVAFGESYALEQECVLDEMAVLALYNRIGNNQRSDHLVNVAEVKEMVDEAIDRGGKKGLFGKVKKSRLDEFGHTILLEKDFEI